MNVLDADRRYRNDPLFHALVDAMVDGMRRLQFSPGELREAAVFAEQLFYRSHPLPLHVPMAIPDEQPER